MDNRETLDTTLWEPFSTLVYHPKDTFICWLLVNIVFVGFGEINWFLATLITTTGVVMLYFFGLYCLSIFIIRSISFPMSHTLALRAMETEIGSDQKSNFLKQLYCFRTLLILLSALDLSQQGSIIGEPYWEKSRSKCYQIIPMFSKTLITFNLCKQEYENSDSLIEQRLHQIACQLSIHLEKLIDNFNILQTEPVNTEIRLQLLKSLLILELFSNCLTSFEDQVFDLVVELSSKIELANESDEIETIIKSYPDVFNVYDPNKKTVSSNAEEMLEEGDIPTQICSTEDNELTPLLNFMPSEDSSVNIALKKVKKFYSDYKKSFETYQAFFNLRYNRLSLQTYYKAYSLTIPLSDGNTLDGCFIVGGIHEDISEEEIKGIEELSNLAQNKKLVIVCNPNAAVYEYSHLQYDFLRFYVENNINAFVFNYRGYGRSSGTPTPQLNNVDAVEIVKYLVDNKLCKPGGIGVHALSIGGIMAASLCEKQEELGISLFVFDRNFASLSDTAANMVHPVTRYILRDITPWFGNNVNSFLKGTDMYIDMKTSRKLPFVLICCDPNDEVIYNNASLKAGVAREILHRHLFKESHYNSGCTNLYHQKCKKTEIVTTDDNLAFLRNPAFSIDLVSNVLSIQTKLQALYGNRKLSIEQKKVATVIAQIFKEFIQMHVGGMPLQAAVSSFLSTTPVEEFAERREKLIKDVYIDPSDPIRDFMNCFLIWQPYNKLNNIQLFKEHLAHIQLTLRKLKVTDIEVCESLNMSSEIDFFFNIITRIKDHFDQQKRNNLAFIPLKCGHNGNFRKREWKTFVSCLKESKWI